MLLLLIMNNSRVNLRPCGRRLNMDLISAAHLLLENTRSYGFLDCLILRDYTHFKVFNHSMQVPLKWLTFVIRKNQGKRSQ